MYLHVTRVRGFLIPEWRSLVTFLVGFVDWLWIIRSGKILDHLIGQFKNCGAGDPELNV